MSRPGTLVARTYRGFRGIDLRGREVSLQRSPDCCNLWRDYSRVHCVSTRPGLRLLAASQAAVWGIHQFGAEMLVHCGDALCRLEGGSLVPIYGGLAQGPSQGFAFGDSWYLIDGANYLRYDGARVEPVAGYAPTTSIGRPPQGGGTPHEDANLLTGRRINTFLADGGSFDYHLDARKLDADFAPIVRVNGEDWPHTVDYENGIISFSQAPPAPLTPGQDNVWVEFSKTVPGYRESILGCTQLQLFDNRVFFTGNPAHPGVLWHSSLQDPTYFSDLDYYREGLDPAPIRSLVAGNNALWVFCKDSANGTNVFYHVPTLDEAYGKIYPSSHSSLALGCAGRAANFAGDIVYFSPRGLEGITGDITAGQVLAHRSSLVDAALTAEPAYETMLLAQHRGYLLAAMGSRVYLADSRSVFSNEGHREYDWYVWQLEQPATALAQQGGALYVGTAAGVYALDDEAAPVRSWWVTPADRFGAPALLKSLHKRGFLAELTGDAALELRRDQEAFQPAAEFTGIADRAVAKLYAKKFKELQLRFCSATRFSLESVSLECWIGGYIRR